MINNKYQCDFCGVQNQKGDNWLEIKAKRIKPYNLFVNKEKKNIHICTYCQIEILRYYKNEVANKSDF